MQIIAKFPGVQNPDASDAENDITARVFEAACELTLAEIETAVTTDGDAGSQTTGLAARAAIEGAFLALLWTLRAMGPDRQSLTAGYAERLRDEARPVPVPAAA